MHNNSISLFRLDGEPKLEFSPGVSSGPRITVSDRGSGVVFGVDFYIPAEHAERVKRAVESFNAIMREPVAQAEAAE